MKSLYWMLIITLVIILSACQVQPWEDTSRCLEPDTKAQIVTVDGEEYCVDEIVRGELCANHLEGIVYIEPDIKIANWEEVPNFLENCNFSVETGSIILVGDHNNTPYYNGCSCHTETNPVE